VAEYLLPALYALFVWWFSTGVIIYLDGLPQRTFRYSMGAATVVAAASLIGLTVSSANMGVTGAYMAFTCALLVWAWVEISFYMGMVTGPRRIACAHGCSGWRHFGHAIQVSLYHEMAIFAAAALIIAFTWGGENQIGMWTFVVLWWMHQSARLNVFLGVPNLNEHFLPDHLHFLKSFFRNKPMNLLFPVSVTVSTIVTAMLAQRAAVASSGSFEATGFTFLAVLMGLAVLEHWFLVLPLPAAALWNWGMKSRQTVVGVGSGIVRDTSPSGASARDAERSVFDRELTNGRRHVLEPLSREGGLCVTKSVNGRQQ
jgi:putative photosynthetic complex assembly protein 2